MISATLIRLLAIAVEMVLVAALFVIAAKINKDLKNMNNGKN